VAPAADRHLLLTLRGQRLLGRAPKGSLLRVARQLVALQAQIPSGPFLSLAARVEGVRPEDIERELLERKRLLRVWCLRLTLHVIATEDLPLLHAAVMRDGYEKVVSIMRRHDGLTRREIASAERAMLRELAEGPLTRSELRERIPGFRIRTFWGREIRCLAHKGLVVHAGRRGGEALFDLRERWAPRSDLGAMDAREARRELLLRYLAAYGSASPRDFAYWTGLRVRDVLPAFADARDLLREEDGLFFRKADGDVPRGALPERLLPRYDALVLGHRDKGRYLDAADAGKVFRPAAVVEPVVLARGRVAGVWGYDAPDRWQPFRPVGVAASARIKREAARLARVLGQ
jgi:uncharacterized protein YcaQ